MEKSSRIIIVLTIVILSSVIFYQAGVLAKTIMLENQRIRDYNNLTNLENEKTSIIPYGNYVLSASDTEESNLSRLFLYENGTFKFEVNLCGDFTEFKGFYEIEKNTLNLLNVNNKCSGFINCDKKSFDFDIIDRTKLKLNLNIGCLSEDSTFNFEL